MRGMVVLAVAVLSIIVAVSSVESVFAQAVLGRIEDRDVTITKGPDSLSMAAGVTIRPSEAPGRIRFQLLNVRASAGDWQLTIKVGGESTTVTNTNIPMFLIKTDTIEIPFFTSGELHVTFSPAAPDLRFTALIHLRDDGSSLSTMGPLNLDYFDRSFVADAARRKLARSVAQLEYDSYGGKKACTAFQIKPGLFLTNLHCIDDSDRDPVKHSDNTLVFGIIDGRLQGETRAQARVVAKGNIGSVRPYRDYAILEASTPVSYQSDILPIRSLVVQENGLLELYEMWIHYSSPPGKVLSRDDQCMIHRRALFCPIPNISHGCDTEEGGSGSPILQRNGAEVIALHYFGGGPDNTNCALPIGEIVDDLKSQHLEQLLDGGR